MHEVVNSEWIGVPKFPASIEKCDKAERKKIWRFPKGFGGKEP